MVATNCDRRTPAGAPPRGGWLWSLVDAYSRAALVAAVPLTLVLAILAIEDIFEFGGGYVVAVIFIAFVAVEMLFVVALRDLRQARARAANALDRAAAAEAAQHIRADELSRVLVASESLALTGEGQVDYGGILEAITPEGATSFLIRVDGEADGSVVAACGPLAASVVGAVRTTPTGDPAAEAPIASFSRSGRAVGRVMAREQLAGLDSEVAAALAIRLVDHEGRRLGWLHVIEPQSEQILEPSFVNLTQLVANQIGVAMENNALLVRVRRHLIEVQRVQAQLVQASKLGAIGELAAAVAHEVNNPLTGILGFAELLMTELPEDDPRHDEAAVIRDEAVRARSIVRALVEFARPRPPQRVSSNLNELAQSTLELVQFRASEADIQIVTEYGAVPCLDIDADSFRQVLLNLFNNAIDAMPGGGELHVTTVGEPERVGVIVADRGIGMDGETRSHIFTPFFSTRSGGGGTGLGLSVSLQIVEGHGGTIEVDSEPGRGSVFTVWLPTTWRAFEGTVLVPGSDESNSRSRSHAAAGAEPASEAAPEQSIASTAISGDRPAPTAAGNHGKAAA